MHMIMANTENTWEPLDIIKHIMCNNKSRKEIIGTPAY